MLYMERREAINRPSDNDDEYFSVAAAIIGFNLMASLLLYFHHIYDALYLQLGLFLPFLPIYVAVLVIDFVKLGAKKVAIGFVVGAAAPLVFYALLLYTYLMQYILYEAAYKYINSTPIIK